MYVIDTLAVGGTEKSLLDLASRLQARGFAPIVCRLYEGDELQAEFEACGIRVVSLNLRGKYSLFAGIRRLTRLIRNVRPDLIHTMVFRADQVGRVAGRICSVPVISSFISKRYDPSRYRNRHSVPRWKHRLVRLLDGGTARLVTRFHAVSEAARRSNCDSLRLPVEKVDVVPRGRSVRDRQQSAEHAEQGVRARSAVLGGEPALLAVGRLIPEKGYLNLLEAMPMVLSWLSGAQLSIAGDGTMRVTLIEKITALGLRDRVTLLGHRRDVPELMRACDIFVFPSILEGMPGVLIEAMMAGCSIVASDIAENREVIEDGVTGLLVPQEDSKALAEAVVRLSSDAYLRGRLSVAARKKARERFDIEVVVEQMSSFYERVLAGSGGSGAPGSS